MAEQIDFDPFVSMDDAAIHRIGGQQVLKRIGNKAHDFVDGEITTEQQVLLLGYLETVERVEALFGSDQHSQLIKLMLLGKAGRSEEAIRLARQAYEASPDWHSAVTVGNALRRGGDLPGAVEMFRQAARHEAKDFTALLDAGDLLIQLSQWELAFQSYEEALDREKEQPWAIASACYCRYRMTGEQRWLDELKAMAEESADECGVEAMLAELVGSSTSDQRRERALQLLEELKLKDG